MPDLEELRRAVFPTAAGGAPARGATVRGARAILPETALRSLAAGGLEPGAIVDALDRAGAAGALLVGEGDADPIAAATLRRATELKLPAWRLARPHPAPGGGPGAPAPRAAAPLRRATELKLPAWRLAGPDPAQVERSVIGYLVNARAELERRAADLEGRLPAPPPAGARPPPHAPW